MLPSIEMRSTLNVVSSVVALVATVAGGMELGSQLAAMSGGISVRKSHSDSWQPSCEDRGKPNEKNS